MTEEGKELKDSNSSGENDIDQSRRNFLKIGVAGAGVAAAAAAGV